MISAFRNRNIIDRAAILAIAGYQRYLSPHKGFSCAHRIVHGGESCSQYVKRAIAQHGLIAALRLSEQRFADCKASLEDIKAEKETPRDRDSPDNRYDEVLCNACCKGIVRHLNFEECLPDFPDIDCSPDCGDISCDVEGCCDVSSCSWD